MFPHRVPTPNLQSLTAQHSNPNQPALEPQPRMAWEDKDAYDAQRDKLAEMFQKNFEQFSGPGVTDYTSFGPQLQK